MQILARASFRRGFASNLPRLGLASDYMASGSNNGLTAGEGKITAYKGPSIVPSVDGGKVMMQAGKDYASLGTGTTAGLGNAFRVLAALFFIGTGLLRYNGTSLGASASATLQLLLLKSGVFTASADRGPWQAGLGQPSAPTVAVRTTPGAGFTGRLFGVYSVGIFRIRSATGTRSIVSPPSLTFIANHQTVRVTFPSLSSNGDDRWGVCVTQAGFGLTGPLFKLTEVADSALTTIDGVPRSYEFEWSDAELVGADLAPIDSFPPPQAVFGGVLNDVTFVDGAYGDLDSGVSSSNPGSSISISLPLFPEEYPPDFILFPPEEPTALIGVADGYHLRFGKRSLCALTYTGGTPPLSIQTLWSNTGIESPNNACIAGGGRLYCYAGKPIRMGDGGQPDSSFATEVSDQFDGWVQADEVTGWDQDHQYVCFMYQKTIIPYHEPSDSWCAPLDITGLTIGNIISCVTEDRKLLIACTDGTDIKLYEFNSGTGSIIEVWTADFESQGSSDSLFQIEASWRTDNVINPLVVKIFTGGDDTVPKRTFSITLTKTGLNMLKGLQPNVTNAKSYRVSMSQQTAGGSDVGPEVLTIKGEQSEILI